METSVLPKKKLESAMANWLFENKKQKVSNVTFKKLIRNAELYIYPYLGYKNLTEIKSGDIQYLITEILYSEKKLSFATAHKCRILLNNFFDYCLKSGYIKNNPVVTTTARIYPKKRKLSISQEDYLKISEAVSDNRFWKPLCLTLIQTGMQINELLALTWQNIDFDRKVISIYRASACDETHKKYKEIKLSADLVEILKSHRKYRERKQRQLQNKFSYIANTDLVFGNEKSELRSCSGLSHNFRKFLKSKGLEFVNITLLSLRQFNKENNQVQKNIYVKNDEICEIKLKTKQRNFEM